MPAAGRSMRTAERPSSSTTGSFSPVGGLPRYSPLMTPPKRSNDLPLNRASCIWEKGR
jgi:hypothetical protein